MHWTINKPTKQDWWLTTGYWLLAGPIICYGYIVSDGWVEAIPGILFNILLDTSFVFVLVFIIIPTFLPKRQWLYLFVSLLLLLIVSSVLYVRGYHLIFDWGADFVKLTPNRIIWGIMQNGQSYGVFAMLLLARQYIASEQRSLKLEAKQKENELRRLQAHIDPHFLFNNLNILDVLIEQNPEEARYFLKRLSTLYRYLIRHKDSEVVPLEEEWGFAQDYVYLLQRRFGQAYQFDMGSAVDQPTQLYLPPGALQTLIENTVKHNRGDDQSPIEVKVHAEGQEVRVRNTFRPKLGDKHQPNGTGLENLRSRYQLISDQDIKVEQQNGMFEVRLPLLKLV